MLNIKKILVPVDIPDISLGVVHQAAEMARHFRSEVVLLHVVTAQSHQAGVPDGAELAEWDLLAEITRASEKNEDHSLGTAFAGLTIQGLVIKGDPAECIVRAAQMERADLIMMPSSGHTFGQFLLGSRTKNPELGTECPVWTAAHVEDLPLRPLQMRNVLCAVDFKPHSRKTVSWAAQMAADFGARLTLAHITAGMEIWAPGGTYVNPRWKESLLSDASRHMANLQRDLGIQAEVFFGSGDVPKVLGQAAKQTKADLLVTGCRPYGGQMRTHGYAIICAVPVPVLSI